MHVISKLVFDNGKREIEVYWRKSVQSDNPFEIRVIGNCGCR